MTALRFLPGQIVVFSNTSLEEDFDEDSISAFGELIASNRYELKSGIYYISLYITNNGEELRFLEYIRAQNGVIIAGLNYVGIELGGKCKNQYLYPELKYQPGLASKTESKFKCLLMRNGNEDVFSYEDDIDEYINNLCYVEDNYRYSVIAAIDVSFNHCRDVMNIINEGFVSASESTSDLIIIGLTSDYDDSSITDLHQFSKRFLLLCEIMGPRHKIPADVLAINLSVDFSQVISGYSAIDPASAESPDTVFSIPFFEKILSTAIGDLSRIVINVDEECNSLNTKNNLLISPAVFAAAGNRMEPNGDLRVRLGYPANRFETIAVTFVKEDKPAKNNIVKPDYCVDIPATTGLKPCFAINIDKIEISMSKGSSYASAWLAGYYSALCQDEPMEDNKSVRYLGLFSKLAWLMQSTERFKVPTEEYRLPCFVSVLPVEDEPIQSAIPLGPMHELIINLREEFGADFCLQGSSATISLLLGLNNRSLAALDPWILNYIGDIDLLYAGKIKNPINVKKYTQNWLKEQVGRAWVVDSKRKVELHSYEGTIKATERLRSVIPVGKIYITSSGLIDTWGGLDDLRNNKIRIFPLMHPDFWERNNLYGSSADCLGLNILQWISIIALLQLISTSLEVNRPFADENSLLEINNILDLFCAKKPINPLFGPEINDLRERVDRRFDRVAILLYTCAKYNILDKSLDNIFSRLREFRDSLRYD